MLNNTQDTFDQIPYDTLQLVGKGNGTFGTTEYVYKGDLGIYNLRIGQSVTDNTPVLTFSVNGKMFLNLYPTKTRRVYVGKDEDGEYFFFTFVKQRVQIYKRKYDI